ncbi:MAG: sugar ABC transporter permease [Alphaproteobacteria bacterium]|nr:sugar ABC transporter permease [Alphaproteobacteria bacterium]MCA0451231.1 sugar ABC transporter permease [Pseudomonadota bacterium]
MSGLRSQSATTTVAAPLLGWTMRRRLVPYLFFAPTLLALLAMYAYPIGQAFFVSLHRDSLGTRIGDFIGLENFVAVLTQPLFPELLFNTVVYTVGVVVCVWVLGVVTALLLFRTFPGRFLARGLVILPWAVPVVPVVASWQWLLNFDYGLFNAITHGLGFDRLDMLAASPGAMITVILVTSWKLFPLASVMFLAALQTIPDELYEAAEIDGANDWQQFLNVTLPGLRSVSMFVILLMTVTIFGRAFTIILLLTGGGPAGTTEVLALQTYHEAFQYFRMGSASALGMVVLAISLCITTLYLTLLFRRKDEA